MQVNPRSSENDWDNFPNLPDVRDLQAQLANGLIHLVEYADKIIELAYMHGLLL